MMTKYLSIAVSLVALSLTGCAYDPVGTCQDRCAVAQTNGCLDVETDCVAHCATAQADYDEGRAAASARSCAGEYDGFVGCEASADPCAPNACTPELDRLVRCTDEFCAANPDSEACL